MLHEGALLSLKYVVIQGRCVIGGHNLAHDFFYVNTHRIFCMYTYAAWSSIAVTQICRYARQTSRGIRVLICPLVQGYMACGIHLIFCFYPSRTKYSYSPGQISHPIRYTPQIFRKVNIFLPQRWCHCKALWNVDEVILLRILSKWRVAEDNEQICDGFPHPHPG